MRREISRRRTAGIPLGRTPPGLLTDGSVTLRMPCAADVGRLARYGADGTLLADNWIAGPPPGSDLHGWASEVVEEALAGWNDGGGVHGGGLIIDEARPFVGIVYLAPLRADVLELSYGVAPPARGRGIATRAVRLAAGWALTDGAFTVVELRMEASHTASRRVAEKTGFRLTERFETRVEGTGDTHVDVLYTRAATGANSA